MGYPKLDLKTIPMRKILVLLFIVCALIGCNSSAKTTGLPSRDYSYLALGDSYTIGESVAENQRWPVQLVTRLRERGYNVAAPKIIARTGWTTRDLIRNIESEINVQRDFDLVSILIGVNNQYQKRPVSEYETELREIFRKAVNHSKKLEKGVFALSIPDYGVTPYGNTEAEIIAEEIDQYNAILRRIAAEFNVDLYNITPLSREAATNRTLIANDSLHPSAEMYSYWVNTIVQDVAEKLED